MGMFKFAMAVACIFICMLFYSVMNEGMHVLITNSGNMIQPVVFNQTVDVAKIQSKVAMVGDVFKFSMIALIIIMMFWVIKG